MDYKIFRLVCACLIIVLLSSCSNKSSSKTVKESQFYTDSIYSNALGEYRKHNVYLPKNFDKDNKYNIIYATDGSKVIANNFIKITLDSLINQGLIKPSIYIASHSNSKIADSTSSTMGNGDKVYMQYRNFEYANNDFMKRGGPLENRFVNHLKYFSSELIDSVEESLQLELSKRDRLFYGFSNGAGFGANLLNRRPDIIGTYICYSTLGGDANKNSWDEEVEYPDLYLKYGTEEMFVFKEEANDLKAKYNIVNAFCNVSDYQGGHDYKKWDEEFTKLISELLKK